MTEIEKFEVLKQDIANSINRLSLESTFGNTPDYILAKYAVWALMGFGIHVDKRTAHMDKK